VAADRDDVDLTDRLARLGLRPVSGGWVPEQPHLAERSAADPRGTADDHADGRRTGPDVADSGPGWSSPLPAALRDRLPPWLDLDAAATPRALLWLAAVCAGCIALTAYVVLHHRPGAVPVAAAPAPWPTVATLPLPSPTPAGIVVDVAGRVRHPGIVTLPAGSRIADALDAAGGARNPSDLTMVDLAATLTDGQLIVVGLPGGGGAVTAGGQTTGTSSPASVDLNSATVDQLDTLPGIGPVLAQRILDWRTANGPFTSVDQLNDVSGIGPSTFADLQPLVRV
jgi:competence protein ComEA